MENFSAGQRVIYNGGSWITRGSAEPEQGTVTIERAGSATHEQGIVKLERPTHTDWRVVPAADVTPAIAPNESGHFAYHSDGRVCFVATTTHDCPSDHRYGPTFKEAF